MYKTRKRKQSGSYDFYNNIKILDKKICTCVYVYA